MALTRIKSTETNYKFASYKTKWLYEYIISNTTTNGPPLIDVFNVHIY